MFTANEIRFMASLGIVANFYKPSNNDLVEIEDKVSEKLQLSGFDEDYKITMIGKMCENILDKLT